MICRGFRGRIGVLLEQWSKAWFEQRDLKVLYGDTDSLFVSSGLADVTAAKRQGPLLAKELNAVRKLIIFLFNSISYINSIRETTDVRRTPAPARAMATATKGTFLLCVDIGRLSIDI